MREESRTGLRINLPLLNVRRFLPSLPVLLLPLGFPVAAGASDHWAFRPAVRLEVPDGTHPVDFFIDARLAGAGIEPLPPADPATLLRRLSLDLTGLPPGATVADSAKPKAS